MKQPFRILVLEKYIPVLAELIQSPHQLFPFDKETDESYAQKLRDIDVLVSSYVKGSWLTRDAPLQLVQGVGAGTEGIEMTALPPGCTVCNVYGHEWAVAEYCFMTMAMLNREIRQQDAALRQGDWSGGVFRRELRGRRLLLLGLGHIGAEVARWGRFFGMHVTGLTQHPSANRREALGLDQIDGLAALAEHLPAADFVVVAIPHVAATTGLLGETELKLLPAHAYLVNVARGPVVDESALYQALRTGQIAGAANDVWYRYPGNLSESCPPANEPFGDLANIIMSPHNAGTTDGTMNYRFQFIAANIDRLYLGEPLHNIIYSQTR